MPRNTIRLQVALDRLTPSVRREVLRALSRLQTAATIDKIEAAIARGDYWSFERLISSLSGDLARAGEELKRAFAAGLKAGERTLPVTVRSAFKGTNVAAQAAARESAAKFVTSVTAQTRKAIRRAITESFANGKTVRDLAKEIKPVIGLTERQTLAVVNRRRLLLARGQRAAQVEKSVRAYAEKLLKSRATMIARTEVIAASTDGQVATWKQAKAQGLISDRMRKVVIVTPDDRLCPICRPLDGQTAAIDGTFSTSLGPSNGPPFHVQCRCALGLVSVAATSRRAA